MLKNLISSFCSSPVNIFIQTLVDDKNESNRGYNKNGIYLHFRKKYYLKILFLTSSSFANKDESNSSERMRHSCSRFLKISSNSFLSSVLCLSKSNCKSCNCRCKSLLYLSISFRSLFISLSLVLFLGLNKKKFK